MTENLYFNDELFDAQLVRAIAYAADGGADLGECLETASRIAKVDPELWYNEWLATAERVERQAEASAAAGHTVSARGAWLRASNYHRTAGLFVIGPDARFRDSIRRQADAFAKAAATFDHPATRIGIPYEGTTLPGYYFQCSNDNTSRPLLVVTDGYDGTLEELYFAAGTAALKRGYNVIVFDGPGQGSVITEQGLAFRPDWENVITPVIDHALTLPGVDPTRIALMGWSFGGYLAPRAATGEHRITACISDSGPYDLREATLDRIPRPLATRYLQGSSWAPRLLGRILAMVAKKPTMGWALRRNVYVHDVDNPLAFIDLSADYTMRGREDQIVCPTFVCTTEGDDIAIRATDLAAGLRVPHEFVTFQNADGVHGHCEMTGRSQFHRRAFDWLDQALDHTLGCTQAGRSPIADREVTSHRP